MLFKPELFENAGFALLLTMDGKPFSLKWIFSKTITSDANVSVRQTQSTFKIHSLYYLGSVSCINLLELLSESLQRSCGLPYMYIKEVSFFAKIYCLKATVNHFLPFDLLNFNLVNCPTHLLAPFNSACFVKICRSYEEWRCSRI